MVDIAIYLPSTSLYIFILHMGLSNQPMCDWPYLCPLQISFTPEYQPGAVFAGYVIVGFGSIKMYHFLSSNLLPLISDYSWILDNIIS